VNIKSPKWAVGSYGFDITATFYSTYYNGLVAISKTTNDVTALAHIPFNGGIDPVDNRSFIRVTTANQRAIGCQPTDARRHDFREYAISINIDRTASIEQIWTDGCRFPRNRRSARNLIKLGFLRGDNSRPADLFRYDSAGSRNYDLRRQCVVLD
jgi:hypothetical protein